MATRADLRAALRQRLEDTSAAPLWDDATLNALLAEALHYYGARFPAERTLVAVVPDGATSVPVDPALEASRVVQVRDAAGRVVSRMASHGPHDVASELVWRWWSGALHFSRPATAGAWEIDCLTGRTMPGNDVDSLDLAETDLDAVVLLAAAGALLRRAVEDGKRGLDRGGLALAKVAERHERAAERLMAGRRKRVWASWMD